MIGFVFSSRRERKLEGSVCGPKKGANLGADFAHTVREISTCES